MDLDFLGFDADNHYYEATDAFTRHLDPAFAKRGMQWAEINGRQRLLVAGRINRFIPNPTFDPVSRPGALDEYFRGRNPVGADTPELFGELEPISARPEYRNRDARLKVMDQQGLEAAIFLPTLGVGMEQALIDDPPALIAAFQAFNRWMAEDWGFAYQDRIFAAPYMTLVDPGGAVTELEWALDHDARFVVMVPGPITTPAGGRSPADPVYDGFWARANEAGITVLYHGGDSTYSRHLTDWGESSLMESFRQNPFRSLLSASPVQDTFANLLAHRLFERFTNLRVASIETGSDWVDPPLRQAEEVLWPDAARLSRGPPRDVPSPRVGVAVLRGRAGPAARRHGLRPPVDGIGLAPRRGARRAHELRERPEELRLHRRRLPSRHAGQRHGVVQAPAGLTPPGGCPRSQTTRPCDVIVAAVSALVLGPVSAAGGGRRVSGQSGAGCRRGEKVTSGCRFVASWGAGVGVRAGVARR